MAFGTQWGPLSQPVIAVVAAIDAGQPKQIGMSAMQLDNLQLERQSHIDANILSQMVARNKQRLPASADYASVTVSANGVMVQTSVYNAFGHLATEGNDVRISEQLATKLGVKIGDEIEISS